MKRDDKTMNSYLTTLKKRYVLKTDKYICNKFGLAEFFSLHYEQRKIHDKGKVLDVGCGALPIGIFLADQYNCNVIGVELNRIAYDCGKENISRYGLEKSIKIVNENFVDFSENYTGNSFDLIVANPPVDDKVSVSLVNKYLNCSYKKLDNESFSYLTNSWHSIDGRDMVDYIFEFGNKKLRNKGCIIIVFCTIDCESSSYVIDKASKYGFKISDLIEGYIHPESVGAESSVKNDILTYLVEFERE